MQGVIDGFKNVNDHLLSVEMRLLQMIIEDVPDEQWSRFLLEMEKARHALTKMEAVILKKRLKNQEKSKQDALDAAGVDATPAP